MARVGEGAWFEKPLQAPHCLCRGLEPDVVAVHTAVDHAIETLRSTPWLALKWIHPLR